MIDLCRYENGEGREDVRIRRYYRADYMALQLIKSWIFTSIGYMLILALIVAGNLEYLLNRARRNVQEYLTKLRRLLRME